MKKMIHVALLGTAMLASSGCVREDGSVRKDAVGSLLGAVAGGVLGAQFGSGTGQLFATAAGSYIGTTIGSSIGKHLDEEDKKAMHAAANRALNAGLPTATTWRNPDSGHTGTLRMVADGVSDDGCRDLSHTAQIKDQKISEVQRWCLAGSDEWQFKEVVPGSA